MVIHGTNVNIYNSDSVLIAAAKSCTVNVTYDTVETASSTSAKAKSYIAGRYSWSVELTHLITSDAPTGGLPMKGQTLGITMKNESDTLLSGSVIVSDIKMTYTAQNLAQGSLKLQGTGELT